MMHNVWGSHRVGTNPLAMDSPNSGDVEGCPSIQTATLALSELNVYFALNSAEISDTEQTNEFLGGNTNTAWYERVRV